MTDNLTDNPGDPQRPTERRRVSRNGRVKLSRNPAAVAGRTFDLIVVGGGVFGAWAAYDAAQRGMSVALLERDDFGGGASADALRAGPARAAIPTLAPLALRRAAAERCGLMRVAPHLVQPLELVAPRYGGGGWTLVKMVAGQVIRTLATARTGRQLHDPNRRDRWAAALTVARLREMLPDLPRHRLAGGERMPGLQVVSPERLVLAVVQSAVSRNAEVLNHAEVDSLIIEGDAVTGVTVTDRHLGENFSVHARAVLNATGPDAGDLLLRGNRPIELPVVPCEEHLLLATERRLVAAGRALALPVGPDGGRLMVTPTGDGGSLLGPWPIPDEAGSPVATRLAAVEACLAAANRACPVWRLRPEEVRWVSVLRVPAAGPRDDAAQLIDHAERDGVSGLFSLLGRRYDAGHTAAADAIDLVRDRLDLPESPTRTTWVPLVGGDIANVDALSDELLRVAGNTMRREMVDGVMSRHGDYAPELVQTAVDAGETDPVPGTGVLAAELIYAEASEGAVTLCDAVLRRAGLACRGDFGEGVSVAAEVFADARGWTEEDHAQQLHRLRDEIAQHTLTQAPDASPMDPHVPDAGTAA